MTQMICDICGKYGIFWRNLHTLYPSTFCPHCSGIDCQEEECEEPYDDDCGEPEEDGE